MTPPEGVHVMRGPVVESVHRLHVAVCEASGAAVAHHGDPSYFTCFRSSAKPFQTLPFVEEGGVERFRLTGPELAITAASHGGQPEHVKAVESILAKAGVNATALRCGAHAPYHAPSAEALHGTFTALHNNCSGKHSGMLAQCVVNGWPLETYLEFDHPLQQRILRTVSEMTSVPPRDIRWGVDGCGVPAWTTPLRGLATAFARLADPSKLAPPRRAALERIRDAMREHPFHVAGDGRLDTDLMRAASGSLVAKVGGEAVYGLALPKRQLGVAVKIESGEMRALGPALWRILDDLGVKVPPVPVHATPEIKNVAGRVVGRIEAAFHLQRA